MKAFVRPISSEICVKVLPDASLAASSWLTKSYLPVHSSNMLSLKSFLANFQDRRDANSIKLTITQSTNMIQSSVGSQVNVQATLGILMKKEANAALVMSKLCCFSRLYRMGNQVKRVCHP